MFLGSEWDGKRKVSSDQPIFWLFNLRFDHSTRVFTVQLVFWPFNMLALRISIWTLALWHFNLSFDKTAKTTEITEDVLACALMFWPTLWHFGLILDVLACTLTIWLKLWCLAWSTIIQTFYDFVPRATAPFTGNSYKTYFVFLFVFLGASTEFPHAELSSSPNRPSIASSLSPNRDLSGTKFVYCSQPHHQPPRTQTYYFIVGHRTRTYGSSHVTLDL